MSGENELHRDFCLRNRCASQDCIDCPIKSNGLEKDFLKVLNNIYRLPISGGKLTPDAIEDIIGNLKEAVFNNLNNLNNKGSFKAWCMRIFHNKKNDYLREKYRSENLQNDFLNNQTEDSPDELSTEEMIRRLKLMTINDPKCVDFIIKVVRWTKAKMNRKQMAEKVGKTYDAFRQYYHRCIRKIKELAQEA